MAKALQEISPKRSGITSEKARHHGFYLQWVVKQKMKQSLTCGKNTAA